MYTSLLLLFSSSTIYVLSVCVILLIVMIISEYNGKRIRTIASNLISEDSKSKSKTTTVTSLNRAPGPKPLPVIGNLAVLDGYEVPYQAFSVLREKFGNIISLQLGTVPALVVNGFDNIKEVLIHKGQHFDGRPNFRRYHKLFCGNKENCK